MPKQPTSVPCRLYVILAREAPIGVIFRRGPSKWVQIIDWNTATDNITPGQWFHGRIYEKRCDLSPNGRLLIYFAMNLSLRQRESADYTYAWTAISKPPYLTALALWPKGDCWDGGGLFKTDKEIWLNHHASMSKPHRDHKPSGIKVRAGNAGGEDWPILLARLKRDGWQHTQQGQIEYVGSNMLEAINQAKQDSAKTGAKWWQILPKFERASGYITHEPDIHVRHSPDGRHRLVMETSLIGFKSVTAFSLRDADGRQIPLGIYSWADWDQQGRLVFAKDGGLFTYPLDGDAANQPREIANFNDLKPETVETPGRAKTW